MKMTNSLGLAFRFVVEENILIISNLLQIQRQQTENNFLQKEKKLLILLAYVVFWTYFFSF
jgi:hypothetical protein